MPEDLPTPGKSIKQIEREQKKLSEDRDDKKLLSNSASNMED